jgi:membrane AbrB-like protein
MENFLLAIRDSLLLFLGGWLGWRLLSTFRVPVATILGSVFLIGLIRLSGFSFLYLPSFLALAVQIVMGILIGLRFHKEMLPDLKRLALPSLLVSVWMLASCFVAGYFFMRLTQVSPVTAILASSPGGVAETTLLAFDLNADPVIVAVLQTMRVLAVVLIIPFLALHRTDGVADNINPELPPKNPGGNGAGSYLITLTIGTAGGLLAQRLNLPVPGLLGAIFTVGLTSCVYGELPPLPDSLRIWAQLGIGGMVGTNFSPDNLAQLSFMAGPILLTTAVVMGSGLILAVILRKLTAWDDLTCLLASAPGGVTQFFIMAYELGADPLIVSLLQLARFLSMIILLPLLLKIPW